VEAHVVLVPSDPGGSCADVLLGLVPYSERDLHPGNWQALAAPSLVASDRTDSQGIASLVVPSAGIYLVYLLDDYLLLVDDGAIEITSSSANRFPLLVRSGGAMEGLVLGEDGLPVKGALVGTLVSDDFGASPGLAPPYFSLSNFRISETDGMGRYRLRGLLPGRVSIAATADGLVPATLPPTTVHAGGTCIAPDLVLETGAEMQVEVRDAGGDQVRDFSLAIYPAKESIFCTDRVITVRASDGRRSWTLPAGDYEIFADEERLGYSDRMHVQIPRSGLASVTLVLKNEGIAIAGSVASKSGVPIPAAVIEAEARDLRREARTDDRGRFELGGMTAGSWRIEVRAEGYDRLEEQVYVLPGQDLKLNLEKLGELAGRLVSGERTVAGFELTVLATDGARIERRSWFPGDEFRVPNLSPGCYLLIAQHDAGTGVLPDVCVQPGEVVADLRIGSQEHAATSGRCVDALSLAPLSGVEIGALLEVGGSPWTSTLTAEDGRFRLNVPSDASIRFGKPGYRDALVQPGLERSTELEVELQPLCRLEVSVLDDKGRPVPRAEVYVSPAGALDDYRANMTTAMLVGGASGRGFAMTDERGAAAFENLEAGDYTIEGRFGTRQASLGVSLLQGRPSHVALTLDAGGHATLAGRLTWKGSSVSGARIILYAGGRGSGRRAGVATTDDTGTFVLEGLSPGLHLARITWGEEIALRSVEVEAYTEVEITLPSATLVVEVLTPDGRAAPANIPVLAVADDGTRARRATSESGIASFGALREGRYKVTVPDPAHDGSPFAPTEVEVDLSSDGMGEATVLLSEGHELTCDLDLGEHSHPFIFRMVEAGRPGIGRIEVLHIGKSVTFEGLAPGTYELMVSSSDGATLRQEVQVPGVGKLHLRL
jgi:protocatechuate 3,4-dioxygenase beta subunit